MADYRRFVTYIFYYENNQKIRCVGSAKIEQRGNKGRIELSVRGAGTLGGKLPFYFFIRQGRQIQGILLGEVNLRGGSGRLAKKFEAVSIAGSRVNLAQTAGFVIWAGKECQLGSQWDDLPTDWRNLLRGTPKRETPAGQTESGPALRAAEKMPEPEKENGEEKKEIPKKPETEKVPEDAEEEKKIQMIPEAGQRQFPGQRNNEETEEYQEAGQGQPPWRKKWEVIKKGRKTERMVFGSERAECVRLELKDLRLLPRKYWYLGSNSFFLHGFFNYRYFILGREEKGDEALWFVGVPGVFYNQEQVMADLFGFRRFCLEKESSCRTGDFGYWCMDLKV